MPDKIWTAGSSLYNFCYGAFESESLLLLGPDGNYLTKGADGVAIVANGQAALQLENGEYAII